MAAPGTPAVYAGAVTAKWDERRAPGRQRWLCPAGSDQPHKHKQRWPAHTRLRAPGAAARPGPMGVLRGRPTRQPPAEFAGQADPGAAGQWIPQQGRRACHAADGRASAQGDVGCGWRCQQWLLREANGPGERNCGNGSGYSDEYHRRGVIHARTPACTPAHLGTRTPWTPRLPFRGRSQWRAEPLPAPRGCARRGWKRRGIQPGDTLGVI